MSPLRMALGIVSSALLLLASATPAMARPGGGFSGSHGGGFSGGHWSGHGGGYHQGYGGGYHGGYGRGYGRGYYGGFYGGVYVDPWAFGGAWGYDMVYPPVTGYAAYPYDVTPPVDGAYIQQAPAAPANQTNDWFYCSNPAGYYPYVKTCAAGWQQVPSAPTN